MPNFIVTIDGPAASGKSTVARLLAEKIGSCFLDTGAMYRAVTLAAIEAEADMSNEAVLLEVLEANQFRFETENEKTSVYINGIEVTEKIRSETVTANARYIAGSPKIRARLVEMQREFAKKHERIVTEGRDQGTVAFADADIKFFLIADLKTRAKRRQKEISAKGGSEKLNEIEDSIERRDKSDQARTAGPLKPADDAIVVDTTDLTVGQVVEKLLSYMEKNIK